MIEAARLFDATERIAKISPEFDAPQFCRDWIAAGPTEVKLTRIMVRAIKKGADGNPVMRNGVPVMTWLPYAEIGSALRSAPSACHEEVVA